MTGHILQGVSMLGPIHLTIMLMSLSWHQRIPAGLWESEVRRGPVCASVETLFFSAIKSKYFNGAFIYVTYVLKTCIEIYLESTWNKSEMDLHLSQRSQTFRKSAQWVCFLGNSHIPKELYGSSRHNYLDESQLSLNPIPLLRGESATLFQRLSPYILKGKAI